MRGRKLRRKSSGTKLRLMDSGCNLLSQETRKLLARYDVRKLLVYDSVNALGDSLHGGVAQIHSRKLSDRSGGDDLGCTGGIGNKGWGSGRGLGNQSK